MKWIKITEINETATFINLDLVRAFTLKAFANGTELKIWICEDKDLFFVSSEECARFLKAIGIEEVH